MMATFRSSFLMLWWRTDACADMSSALRDCWVVWVLAERGRLHSCTRVKGQCLQDVLHLGSVAGSPGTQNAPLAASAAGPEMEQVSLLSRLMRAFCLARPGFVHRLAGCALPDDDGVCDQKLHGFLIASV